MPNAILLFRSFKLLGNALRCGHLFDQSLEHFLCFGVEIGKIVVQLAGSQELAVKCPSILLDIPQVSLTPDADWALFRFSIS